MGDKVVSGAELKVQLTGLGLTPVWFAQQLGITTRTVFRWFSLDRAPARAVAEIDRIAALTTTEMNRIYQAMLADGALRTYRTDKNITLGHRVAAAGPLPAAWHRALTFRVLEHARSQGINVTVTYV